ncbi:MAG: OmcA/MtrC family decaheme c-type cytochrome [Desulfuromonadaceae bacterium]|nr:OmcA/MtrC family decaheme c-type cytochrome [Desulfuromonadaceae bacterium]
MKRMLKRLTLFAATIVAAGALLAGCSGSDGSNGAAGPAGPAGPAGAAGPVTLTSESCLVCHNTTDVANIPAMHEYTVDAATGARTKPRLNENFLAISNISVAADAANLPVVTFTVKKGSANYTTLTSSSVRFYMSDLVPAGTVTTNGTWGSDYFENWAYNPTVTFVNNGNGSYTATFPSAFGVAQPATNTNAADYNAAHTQRLFIRLSASATADPGYGGAAGILDFAVPAAGATAVATDAPQKQFVTIEACKKCHGPAMNGAAHASSYLDTLACVTCHSPLTGTGAKAVYLPKFIHQIHAAIAVEEFPTRILGKGYEDVTYPQEISNCVVCHTASGKTLGSGDKINNWKNNPTAEICSSCHTGVNFTTGVGHVGGIKANGTCTACHSADDIVGYHTPAPAAADVPEYKATLTIDAPANTTHYVAGETPTITVTLTNYDGSAVDPAIYTSAKHASGSTVATALSKSSLYVYGPRALAVPVLTKASSTLSAAGVPTQAQSLFVDATDPAILTDATGFKYKVTIPTGMTNGTYMIRYIAANYGYKAATDYKIDSVTAVKTIQIGTATVEQKISGSACTDCHGTANFIGHNARHSVTFDTDQCLSCHDKSGNHANPIDNRVHAIHSGSKTGDLLAIDWSPTGNAITYPQGIATVSGRDATTGLLAVGASTGAPRCITCHTGTTGTGVKYKTTSVAQNACIGCHADKRGAKDHFLQMGGR